MNSINGLGPGRADLWIEVSEELHGVGFSSKTSSVGPVDRLQSFLGPKPASSDDFPDDILSTQDNKDAHFRTTPC